MSKRKNKIQNCYGINDMYNSYLNENPVGSFYYLDKETYKGITQDYFKGIVNQIVEKSMVIKLPFKKGFLSVCKYKTKGDNKNRPVDWVKSKELGKKIYLFNEHSSGYIYKFWWNRGITAFLKYYKFKATRTISRRVASLVKEKKNDYFLKGY